MTYDEQRFIHDISDGRVWFCTNNHVTAVSKLSNEHSGIIRENEKLRASVASLQNIVKHQQDGLRPSQERCVQLEKDCKHYLDFQRNLENQLSEAQEKLSLCVKREAEIEFLYKEKQSFIKVLTEKNQLLKERDDRIHNLKNELCVAQNEVSNLKQEKERFADALQKARKDGMDMSRGIIAYNNLHQELVHILETYSPITSDVVSTNQA